MMKAKGIFKGVQFHPLLGRIEEGKIIEITDEHWERVKMLFEEVKGSGDPRKAPQDKPERDTMKGAD